MSRLVELGQFVDSGKLFKADLDIILRSNALVQANSGGGKSWLLRRMIEQSFRRVPQIILDPEGEFSTLREKFDFVLVGKGGDTPADMRSAALLAHRLLELGASAIIDLFEMSKSLRPLWCATFVQALVDAPKKLWRELLLYVDEAHELAPEPGHGVTESRDEKLCRHALTDFAAKGRKRGYGVVAATQRLGKLSKDFAAELKNALVGQTWIDIDRERAAGTLGIAKASKQEFFQNVKNLEPGNFFGLGRAFMLEPTLVRIGEVETEHPTPGRRQSAPPPPTAKIVHLLPQLADLPKEAEQKVLTEKELRQRIVELEREVAKKPQPAPVVERVGKTKRIEVPVFREADLKRIDHFVDKLVKSEGSFKELIEHAVDRVAQAQQTVVTSVDTLVTLGKRAMGAMQDGSSNAQVVPIRGNNVGRRDADARFVDPGRGPRQARVVDKDNAVITHSRFKTPDADGAIDFGPLTSYERDLLAVVARRGQATDAEIAVLSRYSRGSSAFGKNLGKLVARGLITGDTRNGRTITEEGRAEAGDVGEVPTGKALLEHWCERLTSYETQFLRTIYDAQTITRDGLSEQTGKSLTSSAFGKTIGALARLKLIIVDSSGDLRISTDLR